MRIGYLATLLKAGNTTFGDYVAGAAELETAIRGTLKFDMAFVIPLIDRADRNAIRFCAAQLELSHNLVGSR